MAYKEKILINPEIIQQLLNITIEIKNSNKLDLSKIKSAEGICIKILGKRCLVKWHKRLRQKKIDENKIKKKGLIYKIK